VETTSDPDVIPGHGPAECRVDVMQNGTLFDSWSEVVADTPA
jgi:hypothetical protein